MAEMKNILTGLIALVVIAIIFFTADAVTEHKSRWLSAIITLFFVASLYFMISKSPNKNRRHTRILIKQEVN